MKKTLAAVLAAGALFIVLDHVKVDVHIEGIIKE